MSITLGYLSPKICATFHGSNAISLILGGQTLPMLGDTPSKTIPFEHALAETLIVTLQHATPLPSAVVTKAELT